MRGAVVLASGLVLAVGVAVGGYHVGDGWVRAKRAERSVTVRGLSERNVRADRATWTLQYAAQGTELGAVQAEMDADSAQIQAFFAARGFPEDALSTTGAGVHEWYDGQRGEKVVQMRQTLLLKTTDVDRAQKAFEEQVTLLRKGVALEEGSRIAYSFTELEKIKPAMIAEATRDARRGAQQFAEDSGSAVGSIRSATQGYFSIGPQDGEGPNVESPDKKVRVVTTIEFALD